MGLRSLHCLHEHVSTSEQWREVLRNTAAYICRGLMQEKFNWQEGGLQEERPLISYGPCQFPTLGLIVQRQWCAGSPLFSWPPVHLHD